MKAKLISTIVEVPREWLETLPGEWEVDAYDTFEHDPFRTSCVKDVPFRSIPSMGDLFTYRIHGQAGEGLPMELAPKDCPILVCAAAREELIGFWAAVQWHPDAGFCVDEIRNETAWLPLPEAE